MIGGIAIIAAMDGAWIPKRLVALNSAGRKKNQAGLARALDVPDARITEIIQEKGKRALNLSEVPECARYLELSVEMVVALANGIDPTEMMPEPLLSIDPRLEERKAWLEMNGSDHAMARVLEDLIILLDKDQVIRLDDLPEPAKSLIERRQQLRAARADGNDA